MARSGDKPRHVTNRHYTRLLITKVLKRSAITKGGNNFTIASGKPEARRRKLVSLTFKHVQLHGTCPVPTLTSQKVVLLSLLALLLRLVLARTDPLKFSVNLEGIKICGSGRKIKRFPAKRGGGQGRRKNRGRPNRIKRR